MRSAFRNPLNQIRHFRILCHRRIIDIESSTEKARRPIMKIHSEARYSTRYFRQEEINKGSSWRINIKVGWECCWKYKSRGPPQPHQKGDGGGGPRAVKAALVLMNYVKMMVWSIWSTWAMITMDMEGLIRSKGHRSMQHTTSRIWVTSWDLVYPIVT